MKMSIKSKFAALLVAVMASGATLFGATGDSESTAQSLTSSASVKLVEDLEWGGAGYYLKVKINRGNAYTVWIQGDDAAEIDLDVSQGMEDESSLPFFDPAVEKNGGKIKASFLYADSWMIDEDGDEELSDAKTGTMYVYLSYNGDGDGIGKKCNVYFVSGIRTFDVEGEKESPRKVDVNENIKTEIKNLFDGGDYAGEYYYTLRLEKGRKYRLWAVGATGKAGLEFEPEDESILNKADDLAYADNVKGVFTSNAISETNGVGYVVYPDETRDYVFHVTGEPGLEYGLAYMAFKKVLPGDHANVATLTEENDYTADIMPGRKASDLLWTYDEVIDETLFKVYLNAGERWYFETSGATTNLMMEVYDSAGALISRNTTLGNDSYDVRAALKASKSDWYYVGVCRMPSNVNNQFINSEAEIEAEPDRDMKVTIKAVNVENSPYDIDEYDETDDQYTGASLIHTYPLASTNSVTEVGFVHGNHVLNGRDWYDWFTFAGRAGANYRLKTSFVSDIDKANTNLNLTLAAKVYKIVNGRISQLTENDMRGSISPETQGALEFTATEDAIYYVELSVRDGVGLDFPQYQLHAMAYYDGLKLGLVQVNSEGVGATWSIYGGNGTQYPAGSSYVVVADQQTGFLFNPVAGYKAEVGQYATAPEWKSPGDTVIVTARYCDAEDPDDDTIAKYTLITPKAEKTVLNNTLWTDDTADMLVFKAEDGVYYNFEVKDTTSAGLNDITATGDAVFSIYSQNDLENPIFANATSLKKKVFTGGVLYLIKVHHDTDANNDSCYDFSYNSARVGEVGFLSEKINVGKNDPYVDLQVLRTASEGALRLNYATVAGSAKPGEDYFPTTTNCVLTWDDGDMSTKTIRVALIPNEIDMWESNKCFMVKLWPMTDDVCGDNEYVAKLSSLGGRTGTAEITILPVAEMDPGIVTVLDQPLAVTEGGELKIRLERTGGANGSIAVSAISGGGTAVEGVDYEKIYEPVVWADGESGVKEVVLKTKSVNSSATKTVDIAFGALRADYTSIGFGDYRDCLIPTLSASSAKVTIYGRYAQSTANFVSGASAQNVAVGATFGTWYADETGALQCAPVEAGSFSRIQFTVDGPGFFVAEPQILDGSGDALMRYLVGRGSAVTCGGGERLVLPVASGRQTIIFQLDSPSGGAQANFVPLDNGMPYKWIPLSSMAPTAPKNGEIVSFENNTLGWTAPAGVMGEGIWYRVKLGLADGNTPYQITEPDVANEVVIADVWLNQIKGLVSSKAPGVKQKLWWRVECAYSDALDPEFESLEWLTPKTCWNFEMLSPGSPVTAVGGRDALGNEIKAGETVELVQGVYFESDLNTIGNAATISGLLAGRLPPGLTADGMKIKGVPSVPGDYEAVLGTMVGGQWASTVTLKFNVAPMGSASGTFCGLCREVGTATEHAWLRAGSLVVTVDANGSISANMGFGAGSKRFVSSSGFDEVLEVGDPENAYGERLFKAKLELQTTVQGLPFVDTLDLEITGLDMNDSASFGRISGKARISINLADSHGVPAEYTYECDLVRNNAGEASYGDAVKPFVGYYTVALAPFGPRVGEAAGNGILLLNISENGATKMSGTLADGTSFTCAAWACPAGDRLIVPVFACAANYSFGGHLELLVAESGVPVVDSLGELFWSKDGTGAMKDGSGFSMQVVPVGGWYDSVVNLRYYYLNRDFSVSLEPLSGMPEDLLPENCTYTFETVPHDLDVTLWGNAFETAGTSYVIEDGRYNLAESINPWGVTIEYNRATGLVTGSFNAISDGESQKFIGTCNHTGLMLMNFDKAHSPLDADIMTAGFYLLKSTSDWSLSLPFNIKATKVDRDWSEVEIPAAE